MARCAHRCHPGGVGSEQNMTRKLPLTLPRLLLLPLLLSTQLSTIGCSEKTTLDPDAGLDGDVEELECGDEREPLEIDPEHIVNGTKSWDSSVVDLTEGQAMSVGALVSQSSDGWSNSCTATLIAPNVVLTAAHCLTNRRGNTVASRNVRFAVGEDAARPTHSYDVQAVYRHPEYRSVHGGNATHDIGLLVLTEDARDAIPEIEPIAANCVEPGAGFIGADVQNGGYGITEPATSWPHSHNTYRYWVVEEVVELTDFDFVVDGHGEGAVCNGDSGGPSLWTMPDGVIRVMGTVSWGDPSCVDLDHFARTDDNCDLITEIVGDCGDVTEEGYCGDGDIAIYCSGGALTENDCEDTDMVCGPDEAEQNRCVPPPDTCEGETIEGRCDGNDVVWCHEGESRTRRCADCEQECGWSDSHEAYYCI